MENYQKRVGKWLVSCFGDEIADDRTERTHRFLEESLELVQACGCTRSEVEQLLDYVYSRPVGQIHQEVGGVMTTLASLCRANGVDMLECGEVELNRVWSKKADIRYRQSIKPDFIPIPEPNSHHKGYRVGDKVLVGSHSGLGGSIKSYTITDIKTRYTEIGEPYDVICIGDWEFDGKSGGALTSPLMYHIELDFNE